jgi:hypothetical protein
VADNDAPFSEQILDVAKAEMEAQVQPHGMRDDLGREAVTATGIGPASGCILSTTPLGGDVIGFNVVSVPGASQIHSSADAASARAA